MPPSNHKNKNLPPDIIESILLLLPAKSLGRFKLVAKTWNSLISDPHFIKTHINNKQCQQTTTKLILVPSRYHSLYSIDLNNNDEIPATAKQLALGSFRIYWEEMLGSCNGLVLAKDVLDSMYLMNPTTKDLWKLPSNPVAPHERKFNIMYGFGYVPSTNDYKVVMLSFLKRKKKHSPDCTFSFSNPNNERRPECTCTRTNVSVYSLRNNAWRKLHNACYGHNMSCLIGKCVLVNQHLHWLNRGFSTSIFAFSLENENFNEIKVPAVIENTIHVFFYKLIIDLGGKLGALFCSRVSEYLWVMEEYGVFESWTEFCKSRLPSTPLCLVEGSNRDVVLGVKDKVAVYNIKKERCINVRIEGGPTGFEIGGTYVESLESPNRFITTP